MPNFRPRTAKTFRQLTLTHPLPVEQPAPRDYTAALNALGAQLFPEVWTPIGTPPPADSRTVSSAVSSAVALAKAEASAKAGSPRRSPAKAGPLKSEI